MKGIKEVADLQKRATVPQFSRSLNYGWRGTRGDTVVFVYATLTAMEPVDICVTLPKKNPFLAE